MNKAIFKIWRGDPNGGSFVAYTTEISEGMVVLDAVHEIQAKQANDLALANLEDQFIYDFSPSVRLAEPGALQLEHHPSFLDPVQR